LFVLSSVTIASPEGVVVVGSVGALMFVFCLFLGCRERVRGNEGKGREGKGRKQIL
jgi:hypothetical protein